MEVAMANRQDSGSSSAHQNQRPPARDEENVRDVSEDVQGRSDEHDDDEFEETEDLEDEEFDDEEDA
jgi:hypothetical protein